MKEFEGGIEQFLDAVHFVIQRHKSCIPDEGISPVGGARGAQYS